MRGGAIERRRPGKAPCSSVYSVANRMHGRGLSEIMQTLISRGAAEGAKQDLKRVSRSPSIPNFSVDFTTEDTKGTEEASLSPFSIMDAFHLASERGLSKKV